MTSASTTQSVQSSTSTVLKNTYGLLSLTLIWSAITAYIGMLHPVQGIASLGLFIASFAVLFATIYFRNSSLGIVFVFAFTGLMGFSLGPLLNHYLNTPNGTTTVTTALALTGAMFLSLSAYVHVTKKDFSFMGSFLLISLIGLVVLGLINLFFPVPGMSLVLAYASALIFSGYILYDTSDIVSGRETNYIMATVNLYLDILNLFTALLRIIGDSDD